MLRPRTDLVLLPAYQFGQFFAVLIAILFGLKDGVIVAGIGLVTGLVLFRVFFVIVRGVVFPLIEITSGAVGRALGDE